MTTRATKAVAKKIARKAGTLSSDRSRSKTRQVRYKGDGLAPVSQRVYETEKLPPGSLVLFRGTPYILIRHSCVRRDHAVLLFPKGPREVNYKHLRTVPDISNA